jgi:hypothetical protein
MYQSIQRYNWIKEFASPWSQGLLQYDLGARYSELGEMSAIGAGG